MKAYIFQYGRSNCRIPIEATPWKDTGISFDNLCMIYCFVKLGGKKVLKWPKNTVSFREMNKQIEQYFLVDARKKKLEAV
jgi:hypothetical protein